MHEPLQSSFASNEPNLVDLSKAVQYARSVQGELRPDDPRLDHTVHLACKDGTNLNLPHAFVETAGDWVCVFTRDHGYFVEPKGALAMCQSSERHPH
jgi:hypothetical protein